MPPPPPSPVEQTGESAAVPVGDSTQRSLPTPFLTKTYQLVDDPSCNDMISWNDDGSSFVVWKPAEFARDLLPKYFKHNNLSSFVRQLNTYGFRKVVPDRWEFANDCFRKGEKSLLRDIQRRKITQLAVSSAAGVATSLVKTTRSPTNSGEGQVLSSHSGPATGGPSGDDGGGGSSSVHRGTSCGTPELVEENERLRKENERLAEDLNQLRGLCSNILALMSNYASGQQETGGILDGTELDLLRLTVAQATAAGDSEGGGGASSHGGGTGDGCIVDSAGRADEKEAACPRLFGVSIGGKRTRREDEEENRETQQGSDPKGSVD
ncbi:hypothetical protein Dimus_008748 [Dionaea muscipula]